MAYVFLLENDNEIFTSHREVLMQRSKLVDEVWFLVNPEYKTCENDMSVFSVILEYILPNSKSYHSLELVQDKEGYKEYLKYVIPFDSNLSSEAGDIQLQLSFIYVGLDADGNDVQKVRKTKPAILHVTPIAAWCDIIPDAALSSLDQRIIKLDALARSLGDCAVDNLIYNETDDTLQLSAKGVSIGDKVSVKEMLDEGSPVVDLNSNSEDEPSTDNGTTENNIVEF